MKGMRGLKADRYSSNIALPIGLPSDQSRWLCLHNTFICCHLGLNPNEVLGTPKTSVTDLQPSGKTVKASYS